MTGNCQGRPQLPQSCPKSAEAAMLFQLTTTHSRFPGFASGVHSTAMPLGSRLTTCPARLKLAARMRSLEGQVPVIAL